MQPDFSVLKFFVVYCQDIVILSDFISDTDIGECLVQHVFTWTEKG